MTSIMWVIILSTILVNGTIPGTASLKDVPAGAELFVQGKNCVVNLNGTDLKGDPDCAFTVAVMTEDGQIERLSGALASEDDDEEDRPSVEPATPLPQKSVPRPTEETRTAASTQIKPVAPSASSQPIRPSEDSFIPYSRVFLERDQSQFGFVGVGIGVGVRYLDKIRIGLSVLQALGRARTDLLDVEKSIEEELDLVFLHLGYEHLTRDDLLFYGEINLGGGQLVSQAVQDDRLQLSASSQNIIAYRPRLGVGWRKGPIDLGIAWQLTYAEGHWFPHDEFGSAEGGGPPENSGILSQGIQLELGFSL